MSEDLPPLPPTEGVRCANCGSVPPLDASWRWAGDHWQHRCADQDAQAGHFRIDPPLPGDLVGAIDGYVPHFDPPPVRLPADPGPTWMEHEAGPYRAAIQVCQRCCRVLVDRRGSLVLTAEGPVEAVDLDRGGWAPGPVYVRQHGGIAEWVAERPDGFVLRCLPWPVPVA